MKFQINGDQVILSRSELLQLLRESTTETTQEQSTEKPKTLEAVITEYLVKANFRRGVQGFNYLRSAITLCIDNPKLCFSMMSLYKMVGDSNDSAPANVERCMRHSIETAFIGKEKPCNSEFIATASDDIRLSLEA
jgi:hypothetical protein